MQHAQQWVDAVVRAWVADNDWCPTQDVAIHVVGSCNLVGEMDSDLDVVVVCSEAIDTELMFGTGPGTLRNWLERSPAVLRSSLEVVSSAAVKLLRFEFECDAGARVSVDMQPLLLLPGQIALFFDPTRVDAPSRIHEGQTRTLVALQLGHSLHMRRCGPILRSEALFLAFIATVKKWAKLHCVYGTKFGFPGGAAWTLMAVACAANAHTESLEELLVHTFQMLLLHPWPVPFYMTPVREQWQSPSVTVMAEHSALLTEVHRHRATAGSFLFKPTKAPTPAEFRIAAESTLCMSVLTPPESALVYNCIVAGGLMHLQTMRGELLRAVQNIRYIFKPWMAHEETAHLLVVSVRALSNSDIDPDDLVRVNRAWAGLVESRITSVVLQLSASGICARAHTKRFDHPSHQGFAYVFSVHPLTSPIPMRPTQLRELKGATVALDCQNVQRVLHRHIQKFLDTRCEDGNVLGIYRDFLMEHAMPHFAFCESRRLPQWLRV